MRTILEILKKAGGWHPGLYLKIDNAPYMDLVIEAVDESGPQGFTGVAKTRLMQFFHRDTLKNTLRSKGDSHPDSSAVSRTSLGNLIWGAGVSA